MLLLLALEDHADVIGCTGLEVDRGDAHQLPAVVAEPVQLLGAPRIHRVIFRPDIDDLVLPGLHGSAPPTVLNAKVRKCSSFFGCAELSVVGGRLSFDMVRRPAAKLQSCVHSLLLSCSTALV